MVTTCLIKLFDKELNHDFIFGKWMSIDHASGKVMEMNFCANEKVEISYNQQTKMIGYSIEPNESVFSINFTFDSTKSREYIIFPKEENCFWFFSIADYKAFKHIELNKDKSPDNYILVIGEYNFGEPMVFHRKLS